MMVVHEIAGAPDMIDVLLWDAAEREWRIGHQRELYVGQAFWCACTMAEAEDLITDRGQSLRALLVRPFP